MNDCWKILGIEPTDNKREVRSAYAAKSKQCHMEENPEEFARLNQAYQDALKYVSAHGDGRREPEWQELADKGGMQISRETEAKGQEQAEGRADAEGNQEMLKQEEEPQDSLLSRLQQAEEAQVTESAAKGALKKFIDIFEAARESGKVPRMDVWKNFFLTEEFLEEQYEEGFAKGMFEYLSGWSMEGNYNIRALPSDFLIELAIAYALTPEFLMELSSAYVQMPEGVDDIRLPHKVNVQGSFYGREIAAFLWNLQSGRYYIPTRVLYKPDRLVRLRSFSDYIRLRSLNKNGSLTPGNKGDWKKILEDGCDNHLYERGRKGNQEIYDETRSTCLIHLYTFWVKNDDVPACILEYMYKEYNLKNIEHSSCKGLYGPLKQEILKKCPDIEEALYEAESQAQMVSSWYKEMVKIVSDNHSDYDKGIYVETDKTKERIETLFARPEWPKVQYSQELFVKMYEKFHRRMVVPVSLAKRLIDFYSEEGRWEDAGKASAIVEGLTQSMAFNRRIRDIDGAEPLGGSRTGIEHISDDNRDFWYYYLMVGYGFRRADMEFTEEQSSKYALGSSCYLPLYIEHMYYSPLQWRKAFVGYGDGQPEGRGNRKKLTAAEFALPDGRSMRVEFYLHYCLYFLDGKCVCGHEYTFDAFARLAQKIEKTEQFFFLLAITEIGEENREEAYRLIEERLSRLMLYPSTIPMIARLLAEGKEEMVQTSDYSGDTCYYYQKAASVNMNRQPERKAAKRDAEPEVIEAIYYTEQESYCFRVLVTDKSVRLYHQRKFGWHELPLPSTFAQPADMELEERKKYAKMALEKLQKPQPQSLATISLEGMENGEKAEKIIEALKQHEEYRRREQDWSVCMQKASRMEAHIREPEGTNEPGYPWNQAESASALHDFFQKEGSFLTESYCVLRFGSDKKRERVFYCGIHPYVFEAKEHNPDFESSYRFSIAELSRKVKEKHWIVGNFGWGDVYTPKEAFVPNPFAIGKSGIYYNFDVIRMYRMNHLAALLAKMFDFTDVTEAEVYKGCLSFSGLGSNLEYCYSEEELRKSMYCTDITDTDIFVRFTKAEQMAEFARWLNGILAHEDSICMPLFAVETNAQNIYSLSLYDRRELCYGRGPEHVDCMMGESRKLVWKMGGSYASMDSIMERLQEFVHWYMDHGKYGWKCKACLRVDAAGYKLNAPCEMQSDRGCPDKHVLSKKGRSNWNIYKNVNRIFEAMKRRTAMTAYSITVERHPEKYPKPTLFDSKIGGVPYWAPGKEYPKDSDGKKLVLLAQINLDKTPMQPIIPGGGMIQFFGVADEIFGRDVGSREDQDAYRVVYHEQVDYNISEEELAGLGVPDSTKEYKVHTPVSREAAIHIEEAESYMSMEDYRFPGELKLAIEQEFGVKLAGAEGFFQNPQDLFDEDEWDLFSDDEAYSAYDMENEFNGNGLRLLGYPAFASDKLDPRGKNKNLRRYDRLLFQFDLHYLNDSYYLDEENGCGIANFFIRSEDLENMDFSRVMYHWERCEDGDEEDEEDWDDDFVIS